MVRMVLDHHLRCVPLFLLDEQIAPAQRAQARVAGLARIEFPVQQPAVRARVLHNPLGNMVPKDLRVGARPSGNCRRSFLQQRCHSRALLLLLLTALGPLLAWRKTSLESLKRNFFWPAVGALVVAIFLMVTPQSWGSPFG